MVLVEAGLMGRPVICSGTGGMCEVVKHGENGLVVPRDDVKTLAEAMVKILGDATLAAHMGFAGRKIAREFLAGRDEAVERVHERILALVKAAVTP